MSLQRKKSTPEILLVFLACLLWTVPVFAQRPPKVTFLVPNPQNAQTFWTQSVEIMQAVAEDLKIDFTTAYSKPSSYNQKKEGLRILRAQPAPDYFLTLYLLEATGRHLKFAEQSRIHSFIFNAGVVPEDRQDIGRPRQKYRYWIGQLIPDDRQAGFLLADKLIDQAKTAGKTATDGKVHVIGLSGFGASVDKFRTDGLASRINGQNDALLNQTVLTGWSQSNAYDATLKALREFPMTAVIWCVSDTTALAAVQAAKKLGKTPGKDLFIGGMDWSPPGIKAVASGDMAVTVGGHFLQGAEALILVHDHYYGIDFVNDPGIDVETPMTAITTVNAAQYLHALNTIDWHKIDFRKYSKKYNPAMKHYDFSLDKLLDQQEKQKNPDRDSNSF